MSDEFPNTYPCSTPLMEAVLLPNEEESLAWTKKLLEAGEDPNQFDHIQQTIPVVAAWKEAIWEEDRTDAVLKLLLRSGADLSRIPELNSCEGGLIIESPPELTILMLEEGFKFEWLYRETELGELVTGSMNPLAELLNRAQYETADTLVDHGILVFLRVFDYLSDPPLGCAAREGDLQAAIWLIKHGADVNHHFESHAGSTPLDRAVENHDLRMIEFLINRGANPNIPTWMWITATDRVSKIGPAKRKPRLDDSKEHDLQEIKRLVLDASKRFPPPTYPNGTTPEVWPPDPSKNKN